MSDRRNFKSCTACSLYCLFAGIPIDWAKVSSPTSKRPQAIVRFTVLLISEFRSLTISLNDMYASRYFVLSMLIRRYGFLFDQTVANKQNKHINWSNFWLININRRILEILTSANSQSFIDLVDICWLMDFKEITIDSSFPCPIDIRPGKTTEQPPRIYSARSYGRGVPQGLLIGNGPG